MKNKLESVFDFSLDASEFRKRLARKLQNAARVMQLEDDDLAYVNAAGTPLPPPEEEKSV